MGGTVSARLSLASSSELWVYCASHYRTDRELRRLRSEFRGNYGYSAATTGDVAAKVVPDDGIQNGVDPEGPSPRSRAAQPRVRDETGRFIRKDPPQEGGDSS